MLSSDAAVNKLLPSSHYHYLLHLNCKVLKVILETYYNWSSELYCRFRYPHFTLGFPTSFQQLWWMFNQASIVQPGPAHYCEKGSVFQLTHRHYLAPGLAFLGNATGPGHKRQIVILVWRVMQVGD